MSTLAERAVARTPRRLALRFGGMSDKAIAWLFITPSVLLLLAINIFPLLWTIQLSFTNYRANRPNAPIRYVGLDNYRDILTDPDVWAAMQATAHFVLWSIALEMVIGFGLALLINRRFRGHSFWTTIILLPMMLSPAVVGNFWTFLLQRHRAVDRRRSEFVPDDRRCPPRALVDHHGRYLDVDALCHADLSGGFAFDPRLHL
jgi:multiple sugar transport system permease protein